MREYWTLLAMVATISCTKEFSGANVVPQSDNLDASIGESGALDAGPCPEGMVHIKGEYCPGVVQNCLRWLDQENHSPGGPFMCAEFQFPSKCVSPPSKVFPVDFCVDRYEWPNEVGALPDTRVSWVEASDKCHSVGKRLCWDHEVTVACEGPSMKPYPYGDGYHRDDSACNASREWIDPWKNPFEAVDKREPSGSRPRCVSDHGVYDLVANVDEWVVNPNGRHDREPWISGLHGGHWVSGVRNRCRALTVRHEPTFTFYVTGFRCCRDVS